MIAHVKQFLYLSIGLGLLFTVAQLTSLGTYHQKESVNQGLQLNGLQLNGLQLNGLQLNGLEMNRDSLRNSVTQPVEQIPSDWIDTDNTSINMSSKEMENVVLDGSKISFQ
ncbi:hypothetical protein S7335_2230 [Synechococcus sp. PCC 7335]|uniref:hypothetical protein n=1 Tax=Synechococcus sp. (strain ATCC 29403 / PCC 7335) TaxID=91464 RepID=UPI00017EB135|nr:hypothetical protein [Synechococcus sp. PCC 7335]EDX84533.1 hypothetical protein S7335_2230 [Synechococcus sp. PCC 7335]